MITKDELIHILTDTESYHAERTISIDNADKFCQTICAFSNDFPGSGKNGYLITLSVFPQDLFRNFFVQ